MKARNDWKRPYLIAPFSVNLFLECPRCFYLERKKGLEIGRPRGPMPSIATGIDSVLKRYFSVYREAGTFPEFLRAKFEEREIFCRRLAPGFRERLYVHAETVVRPEPGEGLTEEGLRQVELMGILDDCIEMMDGTYAPLDHKTRASPPADVHPSYGVQMDIYSLLLKEKGFPISGFACLVYYCPTTIDAIETGINFTFTVKKVETDIARAKKNIRDTLRCLFSENVPDSNPECEYCGWFQKVRPYYPAGPASRTAAESQSSETETSEEREEGGVAKKEVPQQAPKSQQELPEDGGFSKGTLF